MIETVALVLVIATCVYLMRSTRKRRVLLERADYVDVATALRRSKR